MLWLWMEGLRSLLGLVDRSLIRGSGAEYDKGLGRKAFVQYTESAVRPQDFEPEAGIAFEEQDQEGRSFHCVA